MSFLDRFCTRHRLPVTPPPAPVKLPYEDNMYILKHGNKAYKEWRDAGRPATEA